MTSLPAPPTADTATQPLVVVMGVTGCGKTTVGAALAQRLHVPFADADDFHPQANIDKMSAGIPLDDNDRAPWLDRVAQWLAEHHDSGAVLGCSALKVAYRDRLRTGNDQLFFVHLAGTREVIARRVAGRPGHFMPTTLVDSQFATLEPLGANEAGVTLDLEQSVDDLVDQAGSILAR